MSDNKTYQGWTPTARLVGGDPFTVSPKTFEGKPVLVQSGPNKGKQKEEASFAIAVEKGNPQWEVFYQQYLAFAMQEYPQFFQNGQLVNQNLNLKIQDGDGFSSKGKKLSDKEGYAGHWILRFANGFAPDLIDMKNNKVIDENHSYAKPGDWVSVFFQIRNNKLETSPGFYVGCKFVKHMGWDKRIEFGVSLDEALSQAGELPEYTPAGMSSTPVAGSNPPLAGTESNAPDVAPPVTTQAPPAQTGVAAPPPTTPEVSAPPVTTPPPQTNVNNWKDPNTGVWYEMGETAKDAGFSSAKVVAEQHLAGGWTLELLVQHKYLNSTTDQF